MRLTELRRRAGSPSAQIPQADEAEDDNLPSTSTTRDVTTNSLLEKHRKQKLREEKKERKQRDRLDFEFPSETARRDKGKGKGKESSTQQGRGNELAGIARAEQEEEVYKDRSWDDHGHINFFLDVEQAVSGNLLANQSRLRLDS